MSENNTPTWKLWAAWAWAIARLDTEQAKRIADEITRRQPGKPPRNTGNLGG
jgi:hypothetical protein